MTIFAQDTDTNVQAQSSSVSQGGGVGPYPGTTQLVERDVDATIIVQDEGTTLPGRAGRLNFTGNAVTASGSGDTKIIHITQATSDSIVAEDVQAGNATITEQRVVRAEPGSSSNFSEGTLLPAVVEQDNDTLRWQNGTNYNIPEYRSGYLDTVGNTFFLADANFSQNSIETYTVRGVGSGFFNNRSFIDVNETVTSSAVGKFVWVPIGNATTVSGVGVAIDSDGAVIIGNADDEHILFTLRDGIVFSGEIVDSDNIRDNSLNISKLNATGTRSSSTYLRGDNTWATVTTGGVPLREGLGIDVTRVSDSDLIDVDTDVIATRTYAATVGPGTNLSVTTTSSSLAVNSSTGGNANIPQATSSFWGAMSNEDKAKLDGIATGAEANAQSDWNTSATDSDSFIRNKPFNGVGDGLEVVANDLRVDIVGSTLTRNANGIFVSQNGIGANEINVSGNGTAGQYLRSDGDGSMTWASISGGGGGGSNLRAGSGISIVDSEVSIAADGVTASTLNDDVTAPNLGLDLYSNGLGLSSAFINAASVLALSTRYQYNNNGVSNGDFTLSSVIQDTDSERIIAPSGYNNVRSVILRGDDRNTPSRSLAGLASFFGQGSILEIRPLNSEFARINSYGVYAINSANFNYQFGNDSDYIVLNITPADDTALTQRDSGNDDDYGQNIYTGLIADNGTPVLTNGSQYEIVLHGRQRSITGANILPETIHGFALADNAIGPNKISSGTSDGVHNDMLIRDGTNFRFGLIDSDNINNDAITYDKINVSGTAGQRLTINTLGTDWSWETDHSGTVYTGDFTAASQTPDEAGEIRFLNSGGGSLIFNQEGSGLDTIRTIQIFGNNATERSALASLVQGSRVHITTGGGDNDHFVGQLSANATTAGNVTTMSFGTASDRELAPSAGRVSGTSNAISVRFSVDDAGVVFAEDIVPDAITESKIADGAIFERHLESSNIPADNQLLSYDAATGGFTWVTTGGGTTYSAGSGLNLSNSNVFSVDADIATDSDLDVVKRSLSQAVDEINDSIARFEYITDSDFIAKRDFTDLDTTDTEMIINTLAKDSEAWSNLSTAVNNQWNQTGDSENPGALNFDFHFYREGSPGVTGGTQPIWPVPTGAISAGVCTHTTTNALAAGEWASSTNAYNQAFATSLPSTWTGMVSMHVRGSLTAAQDDILSNWITEATDNYVVLRDSTGNNWAIYSAVAEDQVGLFTPMIGFTIGSLIASAGSPQASLTIYFGVNAAGTDVAVAQNITPVPAQSQGFFIRRLNVDWANIISPASFSNHQFRLNIGSGGSAGIRLVDSGGNVIANADSEDFGPGFIDHFDFYGNGSFNNLIASSQDLLGIGNTKYNYASTRDSELFAIFNSQIHPVRLGSGLSFETNADGDRTLSATGSGTANNATITLNPGGGLSGGGNFTTNQSSAETITFSVDGDIATDSDVDAVKYSVGQLRTELNEGIGRYTYTADSELNRKRDYTDIDTTDTELIITTLAKDSDTWSTLVSGANSRWNQTGNNSNIGTLNMDFDYYQSARAAVAGATTPINPVPTGALVSSPNPTYEGDSALLADSGHWSLIAHNDTDSVTVETGDIVHTTPPNSWDVTTQTLPFMTLNIGSSTFTTDETTTIINWITNNPGERAVVYIDANNWAIYECREPDFGNVFGIHCFITLVNSMGAPSASAATIYFGVNASGTDVAVTQTTAAQAATPAQFVKRRLAVNWQGLNSPFSYNDTNHEFRVNAGTGSDSGIILLDEAGNTIANAADEEFGPGYLQFFDVYGNGNFNNLIYNIQNLHGIGESSHNYLATHHLEVPMIINNGMSSEIRPYHFGSTLSVDTDNDTINTAATPSQIIDGPRSRFVTSGTSSGVDYVQYSQDITGTSMNYTIFFNENASGDPTTFPVYSGHVTTQSGTIVATRTWSGSGDSLTYSDS